MSRPLPSMRLLCALLLSAAGLLLSLSNSDAQDPETEPTGPVIIVGEITGAIGPVTKDYVHRVLEEAKQANPECIVFTMDTPGGLDLSMRSIVKDILSSPVPVVVFVHPRGARAASAGAIIGLASHVIAMSPSTNMGAAHPVPAGGGQMDSTMSDKVTNDAAAYARGLAKRQKA